MQGLEQGLDNARRMAAKVAELERRLEFAKADYAYAIRKLHLDGTTMREIADGLGISHQRVHQIVQAVAGDRRGLFGLVRKAGHLGCSFCGRRERQVDRLLAGPRVHICDRCLDEAARLDAGKDADTGPGGSMSVAQGRSRLRCFFCGKRPDLNRNLMTAGRARICTDCVTAGATIISEYEAYGGS